jgi:hypothetical protein
MLKVRAGWTVFWVVFQILPFLAFLQGEELGYIVTALIISNFIGFVFWAVSQERS